MSDLPAGYHDVPEEDRKKAQKFFDYGKNAADTGNFDYAIEMYVQGLNFEAAAALLELGIDPNASAQGWTALHQIAWSRRPQRGQNNPGQ